MREHDARSKRTKDLTEQDPRAAKLRQAFAEAKTVMNGEQAAAIARLLNDGSQGGGGKAEPVPSTVAVVGVGSRFEEPDAAPLRDFLTDEPVMDDSTDPPMQAQRAEPRMVQTLGLLAEDGRSWSVTAAGSCWPGGTAYRDARRARG